MGMFNDIRFRRMTDEELLQIHDVFAPHDEEHRMAIDELNRRQAAIDAAEAKVPYSAKELKLWLFLLTAVFMSLVFTQYVLM